ncbi:hypothetical protein T484DRAFT_1809629 [Baffinella frigidus]|nr:hypothetical protein T484DRAFT_1809629 [Cryptophyta sp. CCMP2293]
MTHTVEAAGRERRCSPSPSMRGAGLGLVILLGCAIAGTAVPTPRSGLGLGVGRGAGVPPMETVLRLRGGSGNLWGNSWQAGSASMGTSGTFAPGQAAEVEKKTYNPVNDPEIEHCPNDGVTQLSFSPKALSPKQVPPPHS